MIASEINSYKLKPVLSMVFYKNDDRSYVEYATIDYKGNESSYKPATYNSLNYLFGEIKKSLNPNPKKKTKTKFNLLPRNLLYINQDALSPEIAWYVPGKYKKIKLLKKEGYIFYPTIIFIIKNNSLKLYMVLNNKIDLKTELFHLPFPNIYDNCTMCFGTMNQSKILKGSYIDIVKKAELAFYDSEFTSELMGNKNYKDPVILNLELMMMNKKKRFLKSKLISTKKNLEHALLK